MTKKAIVVLSGGQDSVTCLYWAKLWFDEVHAVTFHYGQRHAREVESARFIVSLNPKVTYETIDLGDDILKGASPLTNKQAELETYTDFNSMSKIIGDRTELTFVPVRNLLFLAVAANRAAAMGYPNLVTGVCEADGANYPDCRRDFIDEFEKTLELSLGSRIAVHTPLIDKKKSDTVKMALGFPGCYAALGYSHTAYDGGYPPTSMDHASVLRAHGFEEAGIPDPLVIRAVLDGLMPWPGTKNYDHVSKLLPLDLGQRDNHNVLVHVENQLRQARSWVS